MALEFTSLHPLFAAEARDVDLRTVEDRATLDEIRAGMDTYGVLVFRNQPLTDAEQLAFAERFDGTLHTKTGVAALTKNRFGNEALTDISNVDETGALLPADDRRRHYGLANRLWHTDASFENPRGRYSLLSTRVLPPAGANTEFADMRAAWDALPAAMQDELLGYTVHHSIAYSRQTLGFDFSAEELDKLRGAVHPLVNLNPVTGRRSLYLASHASRINELSLPEGRLLLRELMEHATQARFVFSHTWADGDLVIWDNRATMHRARPFEDYKHRRELRRVTTLDIH
ncbi:MAG: TauD/TfdA family dioxygenase [Gammaproteobacteria bacterium]|nr:TauD/TfdA family dioxygenase [Gammaproteobacteria bacterium]